MSDITRDGLRAWRGMDTVQVSDEEFDRLAREAGYVKPFHRVEVPLDLSTLDATDGAKALRALLTDECKGCGGRRTVTDLRATEASWLEGTQEMLCPSCGGRGWLPKHDVGITTLFGDPQVVFPLDWLEAEE